MDYPGKVITKNQVTPTQTSATGVWTLDDAAAAVKNNNWPVAGVPNPISKSLRFNSADSAYLSRTPSVAGNRKTWTLSFWHKRTKISDSAIQTIWGTTSNTDLVGFDTDDVLRVWFGTNTYNIETTQVFRDVGAWGHWIVSVDTTQATSSNRVKIYYNGAQITAFSTASYPTQNYETGTNNTVETRIGRMPSGDYNYLNGYLTEINFIDGQALTPSSFGMTDPQTGAWIPIKYTGTYGTNGFYLNFKDATSTTTLGYDYSGNGNNWTPNGFVVSPTTSVGNDSLTDVPTPWIAYNTTGDVGGVVRGNYATLNPLSGSLGAATISNGNLDSAVSATSAYGGAKSTIGISASSGKWYLEVTATSFVNSGSVWMIIGLTKETNLLNAYQGQTAGSLIYGMKYNTTGAQICNETTAVRTDSGIQFNQGDVIQIAFDSATGKLWFGKNNAWFDSSSGTTGNPSAGTNQTLTTTITDILFPFVQGFSTSGASSPSINFGQRPFAYTPPAGFLSLCTTNLPNPTIGTSTTTQAGKYFNPVLYTGNGSTQSITGVGFQPDLVWAKCRSNSYHHKLVDAVRGTTLTLSSSQTSAEQTETNSLTAFNSDGFSLGSLSSMNASSETFVAWNWNAGGSNATNTSGTITSTVRANTTAGFSIVTYTGNGTNGSTIGHGLGVAPSMIIVKGRSTTDGWPVYHTSIANTQSLRLNTTAGVVTAGFWNDTTAGSSVFTVGGGSVSETNTTSATYVAYCFAAVAGYSAFGSYTGNGSADGPFIYTGFRPRWILTKVSSTTENWYISDTARSPYNVVGNWLNPNLSNAEISSQTPFDINSNGFKLRTSNIAWNNNSQTFIYAAFAEFPFKFANAR